MLQWVEGPLETETDKLIFLPEAEADFSLWRVGRAPTTPSQEPGCERHVLRAATQPFPAGWVTSALEAGPSKPRTVGSFGCTENPASPTRDALPAGVGLPGLRWWEFQESTGAGTRGGL